MNEGQVPCLLTTLPPEVKPLEQKLNLLTNFITFSPCQLQQRLRIQSPHNHTIQPWASIFPLYGSVVPLSVILDDGDQMHAVGWLGSDP